MPSWRAWCKNIYSESLAGRLPLPSMATERFAPGPAALGPPAISLLLANNNRKENNPSNPLVFTIPLSHSPYPIVNRIEFGGGPASGQFGDHLFERSHHLRLRLMKLLASRSAFSPEIPYRSWILPVN